MTGNDFTGSGGGMMPGGPCENGVRTPRSVRRLVFFKELARADGGLAQAAGGRRGSACGQEIIFNKLGEKHEAKAGKDCVHGQGSGWRHQESQQAEAGPCIGQICSPLTLVPTALVFSSVETWGR